MKSRFIVRLVEDRGTKAPRRYFLTGWTPPLDDDDDDTPSAVQEVIWDAQLAMTPSDFSLGSGNTVDRNGAYPGEPGVELVDNRDYNLPPEYAVGDIVDVEITRVGQES